MWPSVNEPRLQEINARDVHSLKNLFGRNFFLLSPISFFNPSTPISSLQMIFFDTPQINSM
jgi:hypothetical protein